MVTKALRHSAELDKMFMFIKNKYKGQAHFDEHKVCVLITELLWGKGYLPNKDHDILKLLNQYQEDLQTMANSTSDEENLQGNITNAIMFIFRIIGDGRKLQKHFSSWRRHPDAQRSSARNAVSLQHVNVFNTVWVILCL